MSRAGRISLNSEADLPDELTELREAVEGCRGDAAATRQVGSAFQRLADIVRRRRRVLNLVQESLAQLRLDVKYLLFDLEVTRRERDELRERLEKLEREF